MKVNIIFTFLAAARKQNIIDTALPTLLCHFHSWLSLYFCLFSTKKCNPTTASNQNKIITSQSRLADSSNFILTDFDAFIIITGIIGDKLRYRTIYMILDLILIYGISFLFYCQCRLLNFFIESDLFFVDFLSIIVSLIKGSRFCMEYFDILRHETNNILV